MKRTTRTWLFRICLSAAGVLPATAPPGAWSAVNPPDLTVCDGVECDGLADSTCSDGGFRISLTEFIPASGSSDGAASYTYEVCSPAHGVCDGTVRAGESCLENDFCRRKGKRVDPTASCSRDCAVDRFRGLSHFDVSLPDLGSSCLPTGTEITGSCSCSADSGASCSVGAFELGDGSCFGSGFTVAKCDSTQLGAGDCLTMTLHLAGELSGLGSGPAVVVDKASTRCTASCMAGPSCAPCGDDREECLTRTPEFWGEHPWITNDYGPVTVCGHSLGCEGAATANADPACLAGSCTSVVEGLCSLEAELAANPAYVAMVRQLTAAKLNLEATGALFPGAACSSFSHEGLGIAGWLELCEGLCRAEPEILEMSGCLAALEAFNSSQDTGFTVTPPPFDQPGIDDFGFATGADPTECRQAQGENGDPILVIGKPTVDNDCRVNDEV